ncbi:MAG: hypothetical protein ACE5KM_03245 [Planctomycetaceae bacterium]
MAKSKCRWQCPELWSEWSGWLSAGPPFGRRTHARNRRRLPVVLVGMLFANGRRTVTSWLRAAGLSDEFNDDDYFLSALGRKVEYERGARSRHAENTADLTFDSPTVNPSLFVVNNPGSSAQYHISCRPTPTRQELTNSDRLVQTARTTMRFPDTETTSTSRPAGM